MAHSLRIAAGPAQGNGQPVGVYGLRIEGLPAAGRWMQPVDAAPRLRVEVAGASSAPAPASKVDDHSADLRLLGGGRLRMRRGDGRASFTFARRPDDAELLHPYLAPAAALAQIWGGAEALHAGALAAPAGAVLLIGGKQAGKSTTLAWLAVEHGVGVVADDLAVVSGGAVVPGPRCLDLRRSDAFDPAALSGSRLVRGGERVRVAVPPVAAALPVAGIVLLAWGGALGLAAVPPRARLGPLLAQRMFTTQITADLAALLDLAALPMLRLTRPPGRAGLAAGAAALVGYFAG